jgi:hypothetical protein
MTYTTRNDSWLGQPATPLEPTIRHVYDFWTLRGPSDRDLKCSAYQVESGLELRTEYGAADLVDS